MASTPRVSGERADDDGRRSRLRVQLVRGLAGTTQYQREVVRGLGLRRPGAIVSRPDTPMVRGMVRRVPHLVRIIGPAQAAKDPDAG